MRNCCGCSACIQACPKKCISFKTDEQGFNYPEIREDDCIDCGKCKKVCPYENPFPEREPLSTYASYSKDEEIRLSSTSGGVFSVLAEEVLSKGGVVFGARFDKDWNVVHDYIDRIGDIGLFRGSKYVQSELGDSFKQVQDFLKQDRPVLFSGTPCQISGLKHFLAKEYDNLTTVEVICHGVPSPLVWQQYRKNYIFKTCKPEEITTISFRDKKNGWGQYDISACRSSKAEERECFRDPMKGNIYINYFLQNIMLRESCHNCPAKCGKSGSDISLGDYWGIEYAHPELDGRKGVSLVMAYSEKGKDLVESANLFRIDSNYQSALSGNHGIAVSTAKSKYAARFWKLFKKGGIEKTKVILPKLQPSIFIRGYEFVQRIAGNIFKSND